MSKPNEERDIYYIPPNFLASGRLFGGMIRARNAIEACVLVLLTGIPIIKLPMSLTVRIIILCLLPLPLGIFGIIGFEGDSLSEFAINWVRWFIHRRSLYRSDVTIPETARKQKKRIWEQEATKPPEELGIRIKQPRKKRKRPTKTEKQLNKNNRKMVPSHKKQVTYSEDFVPVKDILNGIIETEDGRYIRVLEVEPINFLLRSTSEQKNIVASFASWMKISPIKIQIKVLTKKADIGKHLSTIERDMESESNPKCRELQLDYYRLIQTIGSREAITRRFLVIFEYEAVTNRKPEYSEIVSALETAVQTARQYFLHCDNAVVTHDDENVFLLEILYTIFNRSTCEVKTVEQRIRELQSARRDADITMPVSLKSVFAPDSIDLTHGSYVVMDGVYHAYLIVPSDGYNPRVVAGWTSILVNAGEGIDVDFYFSREPKERIQAKLGQQIRINRSRLKDTSDTNSDFDDFESAIRSGYFLKEGLANYEDFYYCNTLVTITADTLENLEWRISEVRRLMVSQDMDTAGYDILTGKRIQKGVFAKTRKECAAKLARAIQQDTGPYYRKGKGYDSQPLSTWIRLWFDSYTKPNLRPSSADGYRSMIENHIIPVLGHIQLSKLSSIQIQRFYNDLHTQGRLDNHGNRKYEPLSASTVKHIHAVLSGALKQAVKERIIPFNPCDNCKIPKREKKEMHVLPQDKIGAYLDEAKRLGVYALFYLELTSGLRRGELLGLEWADLNPETRMLTVNKQLTRSGGELCISVPKTENSIRTIALPENTVALLIDEHNKHPDSPLMFWCPRTNGYWSPDSLRHLHKQMLAAAGVDESVRFHDLRHTFSTLAIQSGVDAKTVAGMLGHYSAAFTLDTYTHVTEQMKRGAAEKIGVFMNASVNVQVNVVHSPSAVVRGDYESDLANCLNPSNSTDLDPTSQ